MFSLMILVGRQVLRAIVLLLDAHTLLLSVRSFGHYAHCLQFATSKRQHQSGDCWSVLPAVGSLGCSGDNPEHRFHGKNLDRIPHNSP